MQTIGLIGGVSWESTLLYYRIINENVRSRLGGFHSAPMVLASLDFAPVAALQKAGDWSAVSDQIAAAAKQLSRTNVRFIIIASNTLHTVAGAAEAASGLPLLHIGDAISAALAAGKHKRVLMLGTAFTMESDFLKQRLAPLDVVVPPAHDRRAIDGIIFDELVVGAINPVSRAKIRSVIADHLDLGVDGVLLACTELVLLVEPGDCPVPLYDSTRIHALAAVDLACEERA